MNEILRKANLLMKRNRPSAPSDMLYSLWNRKGFVHLCFQSNGCKNDLNGCCIMCDYGTGRNISAEEVCMAFDEAVKSVPGKITSLLLGTYGSLLDPFEMSERNINVLLDRVAGCEIPTIIIETHCNTIDQQVITLVSNVLSAKEEVVFEFGFESASPFVQENCLNKKIDLIKLKNSIDLIHSSNMLVTLNLLLGAPFLTSSEQLKDAVASIEWAFTNGADSIVLFPMNIKPYTLLEYLFNHCRYQPISHWLFIELISKVNLELLSKLHISWYGNREIVYKGYNKRTIFPKSCPVCNDLIMSFYDAFTDDVSMHGRKHLIADILRAGEQCDYRNQMLQSLEIVPAQSLEQMIKIEHQFIKDQLGL